MVSKFKGLRALEEILARGAILGDNLDVGGNFSLRGGSVWGAIRLPSIFFLNFLLFLFYIVNFFLIFYF